MDERLVESLATSWPRSLIADGLARGLAEWWCASRAEASRRGEPPFPRHTATTALCTTLFEARRAGRLERGLGAAETALARQEKGLRRAPATQGPGLRRISRLLVLTADGSTRFYRQAETLSRRYVSRLETVVLECNQEVLGERIFGRGHVARAVLLDHKDVVLRFLEGVSTELKPRRR